MFYDMTSLSLHVVSLGQVSVHVVVSWYKVTGGWTFKAIFVLSLTLFVLICFPVST